MIKHHAHRDLFYVVQMNPHVRQFALVSNNTWHVDVLNCPVPAARMHVICCHHASHARSVRISLSSVPCRAPRVPCNAIKMLLPPIVLPRQVFLLPFGHQRVQGNFELSPETQYLFTSREHEVSSAYLTSRCLRFPTKTGSMSDVQSKYSGNACSPCFLAHRRCGSKDNTCCLRAKPNQLLIDAAPCIGNDVESSIVADLRCRSVAQQKGLAIHTKSRYMLKFQAISGLDSNYFELRGPIDVRNEDFFAQFDNMIDDKWAPKIQAKDGAVKSILLICRVIGYCNFLIFAKLRNKPVSPFHEHDLSHFFAFFIIMRIKDLVANVMSSVRSVQHEHDVEPMCFMVIWCMYSLMMLKQLPRLGRCEIFDSSELLNHIRNFLTSSRKEQQMRLETDCKNNNNKVDWAAAVAGSQRGLKRIFENMEERVMKPWTLYFTVSPYNGGGLGDVAPNMHASSSRSQSNISSSGPIPRNYSELLEMPEFALIQPYISAAVPKPVIGATSDVLWKGNDGIDCNDCLIYNTCEIGEAEAVVVGGYEADQIPGCISSSYNPTYGAFAMACSNTGLGDWGTESNNLNRISGEHGYSTHGAFINELWQMPPSSPILYGQPLINDFVHQSQGLASTGYQVNPHLRAFLNVPSPLTMRTDLTVNMRPVAVRGLVYDNPPRDYAGNELAGLNLSQIINVFADTSGFIPRHLQ